MLWSEAASWGSWGHPVAHQFHGPLQGRDPAGLRGHETRPAGKARGEILGHVEFGGHLRRVGRGGAKGRDLPGIRADAKAVRRHLERFGDVGQKLAADPTPVVLDEVEVARGNSAGARKV